MSIMISNEVVNYNKMLEFTLLGYCLRRSSFKLWVPSATHILNEERRRKYTKSILLTSYSNVFNIAFN